MSSLLLLDGGGPWLGRILPSMIGLTQLNLCMTDSTVPTIAVLLASVGRKLGTLGLSASKSGGEDVEAIMDAHAQRLISLSPNVRSLYLFGVGIKVMESLHHLEDIKLVRCRPGLGEINPTWTPPVSTLLIDTCPAMSYDKLSTFICHLSPTLKTLTLDGAVDASLCSSPPIGLAASPFPLLSSLILASIHNIDLLDFITAAPLTTVTLQPNRHYIPPANMVKVMDRLGWEIEQLGQFGPRDRKTLKMVISVDSAVRNAPAGEEEELSLMTWCKPREIAYELHWGSAKDYGNVDEDDYDDSEPGPFLSLVNGWKR